MRTTISIDDGLLAEVRRRAAGLGQTVSQVIEHGHTWHSADRGFARFPSLRSRHPLDT